MHDRGHQQSSLHFDGMLGLINIGERPALMQDLKQQQSTYTTAVVNSI